VAFFGDRTSAARNATFAARLHAANNLKVVSPNKRFSDN
jgi:hypothetical protein